MLRQGPRDQQKLRTAGTTRALGRRLGALGAFGRRCLDGAQWIAGILVGLQLSNWWFQPP